MFRRRLSKISSPEEFLLEHLREDLRARSWRRYCDLIRELRGPIRLFSVSVIVVLTPHAVSLAERL